MEAEATADWVLNDDSRSSMDMPQRYLAQDFSWTSHCSRFRLTLHSNLVSSDSFVEFNKSVHYEPAWNGILAIFQVPQFSALVFCRSKDGQPTALVDVQFESSMHLTVIWPGVSRAFFRVRIIEDMAGESVATLLSDDIESGHSLSDVENPEQNQSFRPWSDDDVSETDTTEDKQSFRDLEAD
jgi:hypothetical protein